MKPAARRALRVRAALYFIPMYLFLGFAVLVVPRAPWAFLFGFFTVFGIACVVVSTKADRRVEGRDGVVDPAWNVANAFSLSVATGVPWDRSLTLAKGAVARVGGFDVNVVDNWTVVGWIGSAWTNHPSRQQYQMAVYISSGIGDGSQLTCRARPRFKSSLMGAGRSQQLVMLLQAAVIDLAST